jgi:cellulose synthase/poly-beta-1,6-N-acetylglucosamine synthase-like glycosyltransferase
MLRLIVQLISFPILAILVVFNLRRILLTLAIFVAPRRGVPDTPAPDPAVLILVPCRDEAAQLAGLGRALKALRYPSDKIQIVLIDDGSRDGTRATMQQLAKELPTTHVFALDRNVGKARALDAALARFSFGEIIYVFDADHRPNPDVLSRAVRYFPAPAVAGVSGRTIPVNGLVSPSSYYSTVESYVHQMVTMRAKDRLGLAPALLGSNCGYRRSALEACGGFQPGAFLEDSELTIRLCRAGFELRFAEDVVSYYQVPETRAGYLVQHARWARGYNDIARENTLSLLRESRLSAFLRAELILFGLGYLDRLALLGTGLFTAMSYLNPRRFPFPRWVLYLALLTPLAQIVALFAEQRVSTAYWLRLPLVPLFFALDIFAALRAALDFGLNRQRVWTRTDRSRHTA